MATEGPFAGAGATAGLEIWRIEAMAPVAVPQDFHGQFYTGDSYIVLFTKETRGKLTWNIHFWLGTESSVDEKGAAAHMTVELDESLGGSPKQFREVQGHESDLFLSYFRSQGGVEYLPGGVASGFNHVTPEEFRTRLLHIKGKRNVRMTEVELGVASLNKDDVFILDTADKIYTWFGPTANRKEQAKGLQVASRLRSSRSVFPATQLLKGDDECPEFWSLLGGTFADVADGAGSDAAEAKSEEQATLNQVVEADGEFTTTAVERVEGRLTRDMLASDSAYVLDSTSHVYVWIGKECDTSTRKQAMKIGSNFVESAGKPEWTRVSREIHGGETSEFKEFFYRFDPPRSLDVHSEEAVTAKTDDLSALYEPGKHPSEAAIDDGSGTLTIWRIVDVELAALPKELYGQFFAGDSYVILYEFTNSRGRPEAMVYYWQGRLSSTDEKGASAIHTTRIAGEHNNAAQVRVTQGKEPNHFCNLFKGRMVVHLGGVAGKFDSAEEGKAAEAVAAEGGTKLFHVKGTAHMATKTSQVEAKASNLNSGDVYVLLSDDGATLWLGSKSSEAEQTTGREAAEILRGTRELATVAEGEESDEFWELLGGKEEYPSDTVPGVGAAEPRLFQISNALGSLEAEEIYNFCQDDLDHKDVFLLDTFTQVFVWMGHDANKEEREGAVAAAQAFISAAGSGRDADTPIITIESGSEPSMFTVNFPGWDTEQAAVFEDPYARRLRMRSEESGEEDLPAWAKAARSRATAAEVPAAVSKPAPKPPVKAASSEDESKAAAPAPAPAAPAAPETVEGEYPYSRLRRDTKEEPLTGLVETAREKYLSAKEFAEVFGMSKAEFAALKGWRKDKLKKEKKLF